MAFKLSKHEYAERDRLIEDLRVRKEAFEASQESGEGIPERLAEFLVTLGETEEFCDGIADRFREEFDEKSENWQEGDRGQEVDALICSWEDADFSEPNLEDPINLELEDYAQVLEDLETE